MDWTVWGLNLRGGEIFCTCPDQPWGPPSLLHNGCWVIPGDKAAESWPLIPLCAFMAGYRLNFTFLWQ